MKSLNIYSDYIKGSLVGSIKENLKFAPDSHKAQILKYLRSSNVIAAIPGRITDLFTQKPVNQENLLMSDGTYEWSTDIVYYYDKYNLALPDDFIDYVCSKLQLNNN